jgi:hypothetical protein
MESERVAFFFGEGRAFVEPGIIQQIVSGEPGANGVLACVVLRGK